MRKLFLSLLLLTPFVHAANWYVLKGATGTNAGTSWTNAWTEISSINFSSVSCGDTVWLGGGTYTTATTITKTCTSSTVLTVQSVLASDSVPTSAPGYTTAVLNQVIINSGGIDIGGGAYITISGRQGTIGTEGTFGIVMQCVSGNSCGPITVGVNTAANNITLTEMELYGPPCVTAGGAGEGTCTGDTHAVDHGSAATTNLLIDHMWMHRWAEIVRPYQWTNYTIQYSDLDTTRLTPDEHEDIMYAANPTSGTMRYNLIWGSPNDGIFFDFGGNALTFYGNVYYNSGGALITFKAGFTNGAVIMYNNTFNSDETFGDFVCPSNCPWIDFTGTPSSAIVQDNIFDHVTYDGSPSSSNWNAFSSDIGKQDSGANSFTYTSAFTSNTQFTSINTSNPLLSNFQPTTTGKTTFATGLAQSSPYNMDLLGATRGVNGWTLGAYQTPAANQTWYIRPGGAGRYDAARVSGANLAAGPQTGAAIGCDGLGDADYPGSGTNQHCAFNEFRFLFDDQSFQNTTNQGWIISPGDTVIIRGCANASDNTSPACRVGFDAPTGSCSGAGCGAGYTWGYGGGTLAPPVPSGTSSAHTKILGQNFASCSSGGVTTRSQLSELYGGFGIVTPLDLSGSQYVDVACLNIDRHSDCIIFGSPAVPYACNSSSATLGISDYDSDGIHTSNTTFNDTLTDMWIHGHTGRGIKGPIGAGPFTCTRCDLSFNGETGWDFDDGSATHLPQGAQWIFTNGSIEWNGCNQQYPASAAIPVGACYSQSTGGLGDGVGTPAGTGLSVTISGSQIYYNTQDGLDLGHIDTNPTPATPYVVNITNSQAYGNMGGAWKFGSLIANLTFLNSTAVCNGYRMSQPITGAPSGFNTNLADFDRSGDCFPIQMNTASNMLIANSSFVTYMPVMFDEQCIVGGTAGSCPSASIKMYDNVYLGYDNPSTYVSGGKAGGPSWFFTSAGTGPTIDEQNNLYYQGQYCANNGTAGPGEICVNPLLVSQPTGNVGSFVESELDNFNYNLTSPSPAKHTGKTYTGMPTNDLSGFPFATPRSMGALEFQGSAPTLVSMAVTPNPGAVTVGGSTLSMVCTSTFSDSSTAPCTSPVWSDTAAHSSVNSSTGAVTAVSAGSDTVTATIGSIHGSATVNVSAAPPVTPTTTTFGGTTTLGQTVSH